ncbi:MAG: O-antigen ligase family protein [Hyphomonas sp.]
MLQSRTAPFPPSNVTTVKVYEEAPKTPLWEQGLYVVWLLFIFIPDGRFGPIRYLCIAGMLALTFFNWQQVLGRMLQAWPLFLVPLFATLSLGWTPYPGNASKSLMLLLLTPTLLLVLAARLRPSEFMRLTMIAGWLFTAYSLPLLSVFAAGGFYPAKNIFAFQMTIVALLSLGTFLDQDERPTLRLVALGFVPIAFVFQYLAGSATALVFAVLGCAVLVGVKLVWGNVSRVRHMRTLTMAFIAAIVLTLALIVLSMPDNSFFKDFLAMMGKDATLTGRTAFWDYAKMASDQHPWFGVGIEGFWNPATAIAQSINVYDHKAVGTYHSFHSAFWEIRVHYGLVGLGMFIFSIAWAGLRTVGLWLKDGNIVNSTLLVLFIIVFVSCFTESYTARNTSMMVYFLYFGGLAAFRQGEPKFVGTARLVERPA